LQRVIFTLRICPIIHLTTPRRSECSSIFLLSILKCLVRLSLKLIRCHAFSICHFPCHFPSPFVVIFANLALSIFLYHWTVFYAIFFIIRLLVFGFGFSDLEGWPSISGWFAGLADFLSSGTYVCAYVWRVKWWYVAYYCQFLWDFHVWLHSGCTMEYVEVNVLDKNCVKCWWGVAKMEYELNGSDGIREINILELICLKNVVSKKYIGIWINF